MKFVHIVLLVLISIVVANGGKINWDARGKPHIEKSNKPIKGCSQNRLIDLLQDRNNSFVDNNSSSSCSK